jgi:hypothetical protein
MNIQEKIDTDFTDWIEYKDGIINENGDLIKKVSNTSTVKLYTNLKKLIDFHPFDSMKESTFILSLALLRDISPFVDIDDDQLLKDMKTMGIVR